MNIGRLRLLWYLLGTSTGTFAQSASPDSALLANSVLYARAHYDQARARQTNLINGAEFTTYDFKVEGHPFFLDGKLNSGSVRYEGVRYERVPLLYDITADKVVIQHPDSTFRINLVPEKVANFSMQGHSFIRIDESKGPQSGLKPGFYDLLYDGRTRVLARRTKMLHRDVSRGVMQSSFQETSFYYLWHQNAYHPVRSKSSLLKLIPVDRKRWQRELRARKIKYKQQREAAIVQAAQLYDTSNQ